MPRLPVLTLPAVALTMRSTASTKGALHQAIMQHRRCGRTRMAYEYILVEKEEGVAILTLNRPDKLNAMNRQLSAELHDAVKHMEADDTIGCIVITGAGNRAFSAGGTFTNSARTIASTPRKN